MAPVAGPMGLLLLWLHFAIPVATAEPDTMAAVAMHTINRVPAENTAKASCCLNTTTITSVSRIRTPTAMCPLLRVARDGTAAYNQACFLCIFMADIKRLAKKSIVCFAHLSPKMQMDATQR